jgi:hypothetical protein
VVVHTTADTSAAAVTTTAAIDASVTVALAVVNAPVAIAIDDFWQVKSETKLFTYMKISV